jgi:hypothetical protein
MEVVKQCSEVHLVLYCIMHSATDPGLERTKKLPTSDESKREMSPYNKAKP